MTITMTINIEQTREDRPVDFEALHKEIHDKLTGKFCAYTETAPGSHSATAKWGEIVVEIR